MRTLLCSGPAWNAALTLSRSSSSMPPYSVCRRSPSVRPSAASRVFSQFCVARYSVKMITRSSDHLPSGFTIALSQRIKASALLSRV
jgi:hypothetical protein